MESAPLTRGHAHARAALPLTRSVDTGSAMEEHILAAGEFAQAASGTADVEALRILRLLEGHHQRLHEILKFRSSHPTSSAPPDEASHAATKAHSTSSPGVASSSTESTSRPFSPQRVPNQPPTLTPTHRRPPRELDSSIASNLASARGIPSSQRRRGAPVSPALSVDQAGGRMLASPDRGRKAESVKLRGLKGSGDLNARTEQENPEKGRKVNADETNKRKGDTTDGMNSTREKETGSQSAGAEPFQRFFSTFETLISKLSAPLAFAGLPLAGDAPSTNTPEKPSVTVVNTEQERATAGPDLNNIFSKAALRAVKESHGSNIMGPGGESFYVVPTTGGTISYAGILSRAEQERRASLDGRSQPGTGKVEDDEEPEFVDAREMPQTPCPEKSRHTPGRTWKFGPQSPAPPTLGSTKTLEELQLENQALKQLSDTLSRRLHMWEVNAQSSSMALQQSLRALQRSPGPTDGRRSSGGGGVSGDEASDRTRELEEQLRGVTRELEKLGRENEKLKGVVGRYREKWEKLKEGARMRREGTKTEEPMKE